MVVNPQVIDEMEVFVGKNSQKYKKIFSIMGQNNKYSSWNLPAIFLTPFWLVYRRMYKEFFVFFMINIIMDIILGLTGEGLIFIIKLIVLVFFGINATFLYKVKAERKIKMWRKKQKTKEELKKMGGTSVLSIIPVIFLYIIYSLIFIVLVILPIAYDNGLIPPVT
jgi:hypothetical protein